MTMRDSPATTAMPKISEEIKNRMEISEDGDAKERQREGERGNGRNEIYARVNIVPLNFVTSRSAGRFQCAIQRAVRVHSDLANA